MNSQKQGAIRAVESYIASLNDISEWNGMTLRERCACEVAAEMFKDDLIDSHDEIPPLVTLYILKRRLMTIYRFGKPFLNLIVDSSLEALNEIERHMADGA